MKVDVTIVLQLEEERRPYNVFLLVSDSNVEYLL